MENLNYVGPIRDPLRNYKKIPSSSWAPKWGMGLRVMIMYPLVGTASGIQQQTGKMNRRRSADQGIQIHQPNPSLQYWNVLGLSTIQYLNYISPIGDLLRNYNKIPSSIWAQNLARGLRVMIMYPLVGTASGLHQQPGKTNRRRNADQGMQKYQPNQVMPYWGSYYNFSVDPQDGQKNLTFLQDALNPFLMNSICISQKGSVHTWQ